MNMVDVGTGAPVVLIPGIQGRWEWMKPAIDALSARCRVITFSLADEPTSGTRFDEQAGFMSYVRQVADALDQLGIERATICGVSYGGLVAALFAAARPDRVSGLVLTSAIPPSWKPDARARFLLQAPRLLTPVFCISSLRMLPEMISAKGGWAQGLAFAIPHTTRVLRHTFSPRLMARRVRLLETARLPQEVSSVRVPTLVITGEPGLDRVVPVSLSREYLQLWPHASSAVIARSGHLGFITRPEAFSDLVVRFIGESSRTGTQGRRVG